MIYAVLCTDVVSDKELLVPRRAGRSGEAGGSLRRPVVI